VGSTLGMSNRVTFLIGPDGRVAHVWPDVDPGQHAAEVLRAAGQFAVDSGVGE
jgi:peroxiredoxin Q/BCP